MVRPEAASFIFYSKRATTMYREMGMTYWREQAEAEVKAAG
jgi:hypothetical protein